MRVVQGKCFFSFLFAIGAGAGEGKYVIDGLGPESGPKVKLGNKRVKMFSYRKYFCF